MWLELVLALVDEHVGLDEDAAPAPQAVNLLSAFLAALERALVELAAGRRRHRPAVREFAEAAYLSPDHFARQIRGASGRSPRTWIDQRLAAEVEASLRRDREPISALARRLAFTDSSHLARFVRRHFGRSPRELRGAGGDPIDPT